MNENAHHCSKHHSRHTKIVPYNFPIIHEFYKIYANVECGVVPILKLLIFGEITFHRNSHKCKHFFVALSHLRIYAFTLLVFEFTRENLCIRHWRVFRMTLSSAFLGDVNELLY